MWISFVDDDVRMQFMSIFYILQHYLKQIRMSMSIVKLLQLIAMLMHVWNGFNRQTLLFESYFTQKHLSQKIRMLETWLGTLEEIF